MHPATGRPARPHMNWLDVVIIILVVLAGVTGWRMGLVRTVLLLAGLYLAALLGAQISEPLAGVLTDAVDSDALASVIAYAIIILAVFLVAQVVSNLAGQALQKIALRWVDELGGAALGLAVGWVLGGLLVAGMARHTFLVPEGRFEQAGAILTEVDARASLKGALVDSALVPGYLEAKDKLPGNALGLLPGGFRDAMDALEAYRDLKD